MTAVDRLRLARSDGVGPVTYRRLMRRFGSAAAALDGLPALAREAGRDKAPRIPSRADAQRELLEPVFLKHGVNVAFTGHEHFYERIAPQKGVAYFIIGSSAKLRKGDLRKTPLTVYGNDSDYAFMLVEIVGDEMYFQAINDKGATLDAGSARFSA